MSAVKNSESQQSNESPTNKRKAKVSSTFFKGGGGVKEGAASPLAPPSRRREHSNVSKAKVNKVTNSCHGINGEQQSKATADK